MSDYKLDIIIMLNIIDSTIFFSASDMYFLQMYELALFWWLNALFWRIMVVWSCDAVLGLWLA
jgi:hypothetical protein